MTYRLSLLLHKEWHPKCTSWASTGGAIPLCAVATPSPGRTVWTSFTPSLYPLLLTFWCQSSLPWEMQAMNQTRFSQNEKIPLETTNQEQYSSLVSCLHTNRNPYTRLRFFIREENDTITTCLTTTKHAEMLFYMKCMTEQKCMFYIYIRYFLKVFHGIMIHKNNLWPQCSFIGWSQCPKPK